MKAFNCFFISFMLIINGLCAQKPPKTQLPIMDTTHYADRFSVAIERYYADAGGGYFPESGNASWAGQLSAGYRFTPKTALGIGAAYWGRVNIFDRSALGIGLQVRQTVWERINLKAEIGYVLNARMYDGKLDKSMTYLANNSTPIYYKFDINWRIKHYLTLGVSATQTANLYFMRQLSDATTSFDNWRINAFTIQLGVALDSPND